jgi:hypothetical protein
MMMMIKMGLRGLGCEDVNWNELAQDRVKWRALVSAVFNLRFMFLVA